VNGQEFEARLVALRPRLHRYCARMTGSAVDGEDLLQDTLIKALHAHAEGTAIDNLDGWLFRIAHNSCLDFLRRRARANVVPFADHLGEAPMPEADIVRIGFRTFLRLPELQRCAVPARLAWRCPPRSPQAGPRAACPGLQPASPHPAHSARWQGWQRSNRLEMFC